LGKILIVDDSGFNIFTAKGMISKHYFVECDEAINGEKAIETIKKCSNDNFYKAIFMDCNMPVMDGFQATKEVKEMMRKGEIPHTKIIGLSAYPDQYREECIRIGMDAFISKPVTVSKLSDVLYDVDIPHKKIRRQIT
jgi:CheY-like chemotaxis protein